MESYSKIYSRIRSTGSYLPRRIVTNDELATQLATTDEWIASMTGIRQRHIAGHGEKTSDMAAIAANQALLSAGLTASDIDFILVATITPDLTFPSTAALVQAKLGAKTVAAIDVSAACSGFLYALALADSMIVAGRISRALVIGAESMSRLVDWNDRSTCVLFGDGAGAVVVEKAYTPGLLSVHLHADGSCPRVLQAPCERGPFIQMEGSFVFKFAVNGFVEAAQEALTANKLVPSDIDLLFPHQANLRIIELFAKKLHVPMTRMVITLDRHANTSAASLPLALDDAQRSERLKSGMNVLLVTVGGGLTWGSCMLNWM